MTYQACKYIIALFIFFITGVGYAFCEEEPSAPATPNVLFDMANNLYVEGRFEEAIQVYEQIAEADYRSPELYYNLGNACYRSNRIPAAILNYERALLLAPGDDDIRFNLELARMHVRDRIEELPGFFLNRWWTGARDLFGIRTWALLSVSAFIVMLVLLLGFLMSSSVTLKKLLFWLSVPALLISLMSFIFGLDRRNHVRNYNGAIVFAPAVSVKSSPDAHSTDLFIIHEGTKVYVEDALGEWYSVRLADGNKGWLRQEAVERI
ncbi:MAG: tetratricopeptide repeat protein [Marinilabiliales bacterium]|nr:MAG: tetratricopeptide repeat protein [Marinilabiliales bacterium]